MAKEVVKFAMVFKEFPKDFLWGTASSSYQVEGGWNEDGKCLSVWDIFCHTPGKVDYTGDIACDSYHKINEDIECLKRLKVNHYRFSLSWCRILPNGHDKYVNTKGIDYYNELIDKLIENGITPIITLYHWDLPHCLQFEGGWLNRDIVQHFVNYCRICFKYFGDRVKYWITLNEPQLTSNFAYGSGVLAPGIKNSMGFSLDVSHHQILANTKAYHIYKEEFQSQQKGLVGIALDSVWFEPFSSDNPDDVRAANDFLEVGLGIWANPIYGDGDYPELLKTRFEQLKKCGKIPKDVNMPKFTDDEKSKNKGTADFFGLNHYTTRLIKSSADPPPSLSPSHFYCLLCQGEAKFDPSWERAASQWIGIVPWGLRKLLKHISSRYNNCPIFIFENGYSDATGEIEDDRRIDYMRGYINAIAEAIHEDKVNVIGYTYWSLMDSFEWIRDYKEKFGLFKVDQNDPQRKRFAKRSADFYAKVIQENGINIKKIVKQI